jgi:hypothetical protein
VHPTIVPENAEAEVLGAPGASVGTAYRHRLSEALRTADGPVQGIERGLLADVLDVGLGHTWKTALRPSAKAGAATFVPRFTLGNRRSFLPEDLRPEQETAIRTLASSSANPLVRGTLFDVLWARFGNHLDARAAADARVASAALLGAADWFEVTAELNRATQLAMQVNDLARLRDTIAPAVDAAGQRAVREDDLGVFVGTASELYAVLLDARFVRAAGAHGERWATTALLAAHELRRRRDHQRAEDALAVAAALLAGAKQADMANLVRAERIAWMLERGEAEGGLMRAHLVQAAIDDATEAGLTDLATVAKAKLRDAVNDATASMKGISFDIRLPGEIAKALHETALRSSTAPSAVRSLSVAPWLTSMPVAKFENAAREEADTALFLHMIPSVQYRDGKVSGLASSSDEKLREAVGRHASLYLAHAELAADHFLSIAFPRFDGETLLHSLGRPSWMDGRRLPWLARASERFAAQDFASCGAIVLTQYEGMLRDLARAAGHHAIKYDAGTTQDETLNSLLRVPAVRELLGEEHAWFVEYLLCRAEMGPNLRNELAHGNLDARELRPGVVFLVWVLLVRLALYDRGEDLNATPPADASDGNDDPSGD